MIDHFIILPVLVHMLTAIIAIFFWQKINIQRVISILGSSAGLVLAWKLFVKTSASGILTMQAGGWRAPFGITFVSDTFSSVLVLLTAIVAFSVSLYSTAAVSTNRIKYGYFAIFHFLIMGLNGAFLTGDIFNLYVWFEIVIISSFVLMTLGGRKPQMEGAIKYVAMNMLASTIFLTAIGILYGMTGSLNMADLAGKVAQIENRGLVDVTALLFFVAFGIKSAVFPLYFWLPSSYHTPPSSIAALFGGLLTKVGIYAMFRIFTLIFVPDHFMMSLFIIVAIMTLVTGALGAMSKNSMRRMFSYLIVCHIGYFIVGLGLFTEIAIAGAIFYLIHDIIVKTNLFLVSGVIYKARGSTDLRRLGGFYKDYPKLSILFAIVLFSLVGIPPLSGFWPKINLFLAALTANSLILILTLIFASFITLYLIAKIWLEVFWKSLPKGDIEKGDEFEALPKEKKFMLILPVVSLAAVSLFIGFGAEYVMQISQHIAKEMIDTQPYINAVLGNRLSK
jgi:multicomponent Na+:H+ antiporter subunit D